MVRSVFGLVCGCWLVTQLQQWNQFILELADNGGGIAKQHIDHIFDPFFTTKTVGDGMGMGLPISLGIVKKHRGNMTVDSVLGQGCCFTLRLPLGTDVDTIKE